MARKNTAHSVWNPEYEANILEHTIGDSSVPDRIIYIDSVLRELNHSIK